MFLSDSVIIKSYEQLINLDPQHGGAGKSRKEKVSALRHLLAASLVLKNISPGNGGAVIQSANLAVGSADRKAFVKAVGEIVSIDNTSRYSADFAGEFAEADDFAVGSNFLTTIVAGSRGGRPTPYPKRPEPLLDIVDEKISIKSNVKDSLEQKYNLNEIKVPLVLWLLRSVDIQSTPPADINGLQSAFATAISSKFDPLVSTAITPTKNEWDTFIKASGINVPSMFVPSLASHAQVLAVPSITTATTAVANIQDIANKSYQDFRASNLILRQELALRFITSLLTKRFVILTGLSGSGKTKLAHAFAAWISETNEQYRLVAVGADWTTNENVLGYQDALQKDIYRKPTNGALDLILRADSDPVNPYFLILDEMNLSHVERYFADILSAVESGQEIALHSAADSLKSNEDDPTPVPQKVRLPENLFIIGTVNVDETTYMFSPKVLDRANVVEFRAAAEDVATFLDAPSKVDMNTLAGRGAAFGQAFTAEAVAEAVLDGSTAMELKERLMEIFGTLAGIGAEFGFRTTYEITRFVSFHKKLSGSSWQFKDSLDAQVLQKLMPKLHGSERKLGPILEALDAFCETHGCAASREKIKRMQDRLKFDGFTSFAEA